MRKKRNTAESIKRRPVLRFEADTDKGLSSRQVQEYRDNGWVNEPVEPQSKTVKEIIKGNLFTYFNMVFAVLAVLLIIAGSFRNLTFLVVVVSNMLIGIIQEIRAKKVLDKLTVLEESKVRVVRDGKEQEISAKELVLDDIVLWSAGNQICADAILVKGGVSVNESLLTGEADEITKNPGDTLMSGSFIVSGECYARIDKIGEDSYISRLTLEAKAMKHEEQSEMIRVLDRLVGVMGILIIPIGILLFVQQYVYLNTPLSESIVSMVAAVIGMIPEGLYLLASITLVVSVMRLASQKVLVHDMKCIETLARVNVLCVDKTGTITENDMQVNGVVPMEGYDSGKMPGLKILLSDFIKEMPEDNITMKAMKQFFRLPSQKKALSVIPFSSVYKYCGVVFPDGAYVLGAPEFVLREDYGSYKAQIEGYGAEGYRVLVFASYDGVPDGKELAQKAIPLGLVVLSNPVRKEAAETFRYFARQGVDIKVISGDNPLTVSQVALQAGVENAENYIDASVLGTEEEVQAAALKYNVFGRVTPEQKRQIVGALKNAGCTVAMTGDGVNDVLALKDADCSVAMASGCDAAAKVSQMVLLESDFAAMPSIVTEGRRVVNNIERSASLFLVKNIFSFLMAVFSVCFMINYPLEPSQVSLISMFTIGIPAFLLALQPNKNIIRGHFLSNVMIKALPAGITDFIVVGTLVIFGQVFGVAESDISTACTMLLAIVGFMILYHISKPMNALRWCIWGGCITGLILCSLFLSDLFAVGMMSGKCIMLFVLFAVVTEPVLRYGTMIVERIGEFISSRKERT